MTLTGAGDATISALASHPLGAWMATAAVGVTVPLGRTVQNPFELGRLGLKHQHIQFGTGTWDPVLGLAARRPLAGGTLTAGASVRFSPNENAHGYRPGTLAAGSVGLAHPLGRGWSGNAGIALAKENAERWSGRLEEEGNLGRTDLTLSIGLAHGFGRAGVFSVAVQPSLYNHTEGAQVTTPIAFALGWSR